jgi:hypothetical protein
MALGYGLYLLFRYISGLLNVQNSQTTHSRKKNNPSKVDAMPEADYEEVESKLHNQK